jgi:hypothetical protein
MVSLAEMLGVLLFLNNNSMTGQKLVLIPDPDKPYLVKLFDLIDLKKRPKTCLYKFKVYTRNVSDGVEWITYKDGITPNMQEALELGVITQIVDLYHQETYYHSKTFGKVYTSNN